MPKSVNRVTLLGNVGKDPEMKYSQSGTAIARLSIATEDRYKDKSGDWQTKTEWHSATAFAKTAEIIGEYVKKGNKIYIEGKLQTTSWDDKETGQKKYKTEIVINDLVLLGSRESGGTSSAPQQAKPQPASKPKDEGWIDDSDSIPF